MCLAVLDWNPDSTTPIKVVANRDEFRDRPALAMHWWQQNPTILAGKDLKAGGTWLGFNRRGQFALLTNIRPGFVGQTGELSRGDLVLAFLNGDESINSFHQRILKDIHRYGGFNLIIGDAQTVFWFSSTNPHGQFLPAGIHGLSNDSLNTPWPKTQLAIEQMQQQGNTLFSHLTEHRILHSQEQAAQDQLPSTGVPLAWETKLSAQTITGADYGTRCRTHFVLTKAGETKVAEQQIDADGQVSSTVNFSFTKTL